VSYDYRRRCDEQLKADRTLVEQAAVHLRRQSILAAYARVSARSRRSLSRSFSTSSPATSAGLGTAPADDRLG
jgi:hypothetical protein